MRVNRLYVFLSALLLGLANLAVPFGLAALPYYDTTHLLFSCALAAIVFFVAHSEDRWRFPWWASLILASLVFFVGVWLEGQDKVACNDARIVTRDMLPLIYLLLIVQGLLLVKLTAPRTGADFRIEQGIGLLFVLFGCLASRAAWFGVLLLLYLGTGVVTLMAYHFRRRLEGEGMCRVHVTVRPLRAAAPGSAGRLRPRSLLFWGLIVVPLVLVPFLLVPRPDFIWGAEGPDAGSFEEGMDLNQNGFVRMRMQTAFTVKVLDNGSPVPNLRADQRWRGAVCTSYRGGHWYPALENPESVRRTGPFSGNREVGPNEREFDFRVTPKEARGLVLADPVVSAHPNPVQVSNAPWGSYPLFYADTATIGRTFERDRALAYTQYVSRTADPDRTPAPDFDAGDDLIGKVPPGIRTNTTMLLRKFAAEERYGLDESDLDIMIGGARDQPPRASLRGERIAVALTQYLHSSRDFVYTLDRPRVDKTIDATEDFLVNTHAGHCERFASALALMLRSQGVPARVVVGYKGHLSGGNGNYTVRQLDLHAWVEALVPPRGTASIGAAVGAAGCDQWVTGQAQPEWLSLDPTTYYSAPPPATTTWFSSFLGSISSWWPTTNWNFNLFRFDGTMQADLFSSAAANLPYLLVGVLVLGMLIYLARFGLQWLGWTPAATSVAEPFYQRLLQLLAWYRGLEPQPAQTPREFAAAAAEALQANARSRDVAGLPAWIIELYYRVRYGGRPLVDEEKRAVEGRLEELKAGLK